MALARHIQRQQSWLSRKYSFALANWELDFLQIRLCVVANGAHPYRRFQRYGKYEAETLLDQPHGHIGLTSGCCEWPSVGKIENNNKYSITWILVNIMSIGGSMPCMTLYRWSCLIPFNSRQLVKLFASVGEQIWRNNMNFPGWNHFKIISFGYHQNPIKLTVIQQ